MQKAVSMADCRKYWEVIIRNMSKVFSASWSKMRWRWTRGGEMCECFGLHYKLPRGFTDQFHRLNRSWSLSELVTRTPIYPFYWSFTVTGYVDTNLKHGWCETKKTDKKQADGTIGACTPRQQYKRKSNAAVGVHVLREIVSGSGARNHSRCTRIWVRASSFAKIFPDIPKSLG